MARFTDTTGAETDSVFLRDVEYRAKIRDTRTGVDLGTGTVTAHLAKCRTGVITHALVRRPGRAVPFCMPMGWLTALPPPIRTATIIPFPKRSLAHA